MNKNKNIITLKDATGKKYNFDISVFGNSYEQAQRYFKHLLYKNLKIASLHKRYTILKKFFESIGEVNIHQIYPFHIDEFISDLKESQVHNAVYYLEEFFAFNRGYINYLTLERIQKHKRVIKSPETEQFQSLPRDFYNSITSICIKEMENKSNTLDERLCYAMIVIQSQIGIRASELINLRETDIVGNVNLDVGNFLRYRIFKHVPDSKKSITAETYLNKTAVKAFCIAAAISKKNDNSDENRIFVPSSYKYKDLNAFLRDICLKNKKNLLTLNNPWYNEAMDTYQTDEGTICYPTLHQFRVFRINWYYLREVPLEVIGKTIGHRDSWTTSCYTRDEYNLLEETQRMIYGGYSLESIHNIMSIADETANPEEIANKTKIPNGYCSKKTCPLRNQI